MTGTGVYTYNYGRARTAGEMPVFQGKTADAAPNAAKNAAALKPAAGGAESAGTAETTSFMDVIGTIIDIVNPLQHIPVVNAIYRHVTGDEIAPGAKIAGGTLYGGPIGAAVSLADVMFEHSTGQDFGETAFAMLDGDTTPAPTQYAENRISSNPAGTDGIVWNTEPASTPTHTPTPVPASKDAEDRSSSPARLHQQDAPAVPGRGEPPGRPPEPIATSPNNLILATTQEEEAKTHAYFQTSDPADPAHDRAAIAAKMMEALDKYGALKKDGLAPSRAPALSQTY